MEAAAGLHERMATLSHFRHSPHHVCASLRESAVDKSPFRHFRHFSELYGMVSLSHFFLA
jgi:hypothetical protein